ncbi:GNAT family N-acetyltransferase [Roseibium sp.]|uniref:GNAT family N-acetyltransferase n=1 Tax=Roseibium sp. TaxID=1936156 RepID=UPI003B504C0A
MTQSRSPAKIRSFEPGDLSLLLSLNSAAVPAVNKLGAEQMLDLVNQSLECLVALLDDTPVGMLLCFGEGADYASPNYRWLSDRFEHFAYTDRIFVDDTQRGQKIGDALYSELFDRMAGTGRCFTCEVNERPPNPGSLRFHSRLGFEEIGRADNGATSVIYMRRDPEPAR